MPRPPPEVIDTHRLSLTPLKVDDVAEMVPVLSSAELYRYIGGEPPTADELSRQYEFQVAGSPRDEEWWLNWIVRLAADGTACGYVQATVIGDCADIAWVIGVRWQGRGLATEAARGMVRWLSRRGVCSVVADIHPGHVASQRVATALGLRPTDTFIDGERRWAGVPPGD